MLRSSDILPSLFTSFLGFISIFKMKEKVFLETNQGEFEIYFKDYPKWRMFPYELKCEQVKKMWEEWWTNNGGIPDQD